MNTQMPRLCFGGSFNPIHHGHLLCARAAAERLGFEGVLLIPTAQPPHKPDQTQLAEAKDRLEMCRLAVAGDNFFSVSDLEMTRSGPSYTLDTIRQLKSNGWGTVSWLIGADMLNYLPKWHRPLEIIQEANLVVMARPGWQFDWGKLGSPYQNLRQNVVEAPLIDISATACRGRVAAGLSIAYLTPPAVCQYIADNGLYR
ncbi:MAG: nicotinate (nicotinamide) nucleotide adenylyltransferase [Phycisphaerales bacterium]|jgi:nicotinate-nucleotide adenylyltransferase|nr:nicotinate (nicotinamide) nucleotide adenylyltransferase [Phycisphaerales bacterium]